MSEKKKRPKARRNRYKKNIQQRRRKMMRRLWTSLKLMVLIVVLLSASALFMMGYAAVTRSEYFRTQLVDISGHSRLSREALLAQAGLQQGDNLLAVNLRLVRKRLLAHPWIAAARVAREIPGVIAIEVVEHTPVAIIDLGRHFLINTKGRIFKEYKGDDPKDLPMITGIAYADISLGDDALSPALEAVLQVLQISRAKASAVPYGAIQRLHLDKQMGITLTVRPNQHKVKLGFGHFQAKFDRLKQLQPKLKHNRKWRRFQVIDLNNPEQVVVQLGSTPGA